MGTINYDEELSSKDLIKFFKRNTRLLSIFVFIGIILSYINLRSYKKLWKGEVQIVVSNSKNDNNTNNSMSNLIFNNVSNGNLSTQLEILKSPSVLMPIYNYINEKKILKDKNYIANSFKKWRKGSLEIELLKGTSVLNVTYFDTTKNNIIPVLKKISEEYKKYPYESNLSNVEKQSKFLKAKIEKSELKKEILLEKNSGNTSFKRLNNIDNSDELDDGIEFILLLVPEIKEMEIYKILTKIENEYLNKSLVFTSNNNEMKKYKKLISSKKEKIKKLAIDLLEAKKLSINDPWELITQPTLFEKEIDNRLNLVLKILILSLSIGILFSFINELVEDKIYDNKNLKSILKDKLISRIYSNSESSWLDELNYIESIYKDLEILSFIIIDEDKNNYDLINEKIKKNLNIKRFTLSDNLLDLYKDQKSILFIIEGKTKLEKLSRIIEKIHDNKIIDIKFVLLKN